MNLIVTASPRCAEIIAPNLRIDDKNELEAASGKMEPLEVLLRGIQGSREAWCIYDDKNPIAIFGVCTDVSQIGVGVPWMVGTDKVQTNARFILQQTKRWVSILGRQYNRLENLVDARNTVHIRWLKWAGFTVQETGPTLGGFVFLPFFMEFNNQCVPLPQSFCP